MPRAARRDGGCPNPGNIQGQVARSLSNLLYLKMFLFIAWALGSITFKGPFQPKPFHDSMIVPCSALYFYKFIRCTILKTTVLCGFGASS